MNDTKTAVLKIVDDYCKERLALAAEISPAYQTLWQELAAYVAGGGKRIRPYLVDLAYRAHGGDDQAAIAPVAAAWELLHACLLIHDDIIDQDYVRHGQPNIAGSYISKLKGDTHLADSVALIAGDIALSGSYQLILQSTLPLPELRQTLLRFGRTIDIVAGGQLMDAIAPTLPESDIDTDTINYAKTAVYTFIGPLCCGAEIAGADQPELDLLTQLGTELGTGYQLADDLLSVFGDSNETGKSTSSDLVSGKRTRLFAETCRLGNAAEVNQALADHDVTTLRNLMESTGAKSYVEQLIDEHAAAARDIVTRLKWPEAERQELDAVITKALYRTA